MLENLFIVLHITALLSSANYILCTNILGQRPIFRIWAIYTCAMTAGTLVLNIFMMSGYFNGLLWVSMFSLYPILLAYLIHRICFLRFSIALGGAALSFFVGVTTADVFYNICIKIWPATTERINNYWFYAFFYNALPYICIFLFSLLIGMILQKMNFHRYFEHLFSSKLLSGVTLTVCLLTMNLNQLLMIYYPEIAANVLYYVAVFSLLFLFLFVVQFFAMVVEGRARLRMQQALIAQQAAYSRSLEGIHRELQTFRHDFKNIISGVSLQAADGDLEGVTRFLKKTVSYFDERIGKELLSMTELSNVHNAMLKSMLGMKIAHMQSSKVSVNLEVRYPVVILPLREEDLIRCIGILIDNAIEAAEKEPDGKVHIIILQEPKELRIAVSNSCAQRPKIQEMSKMGFSSKGAGRGIGLASYYGILARYPEVLHAATWEDGLFTQEIRIRMQGGIAK